MILKNPDYVRLVVRRLVLVLGGSLKQRLGMDSLGFGLVISLGVVLSGPRELQQVCDNVVLGSSV